MLIQRVASDSTGQAAHRESPSHLRYLSSPPLTASEHHTQDTNEKRMGSRRKLAIHHTCPIQSSEIQSIFLVKPALEVLKQLSDKHTTPSSLHDHDHPSKLRYETLFSASMRLRTISMLPLCDTNQFMFAMAHEGHTSHSMLPMLLSGWYYGMNLAYHIRRLQCTHHSRSNLENGSI